MPDPRAQCEAEIRAALEALRRGEPREDLLLLWLMDWQLELALLTAETNLSYPVRE